MPGTHVRTRLMRIVCLIYFTESGDFVGERRKMFRRTRTKATPLKRGVPTSYGTNTLKGSTRVLNKSI